jgi:hypothetical protein
VCGRSLLHGDENQRYADYASRLLLAHRTAEKVFCFIDHCQLRSSLVGDGYRRVAGDFRWFRCSGVATVFAGKVGNHAIRDFMLASLAIERAEAVESPYGFHKEFIKTPGLLGISRGAFSQKAVSDPWFALDVTNPGTSIQLLA